MLKGFGVAVYSALPRPVEAQTEVIAPARLDRDREIRKLFSAPVAHQLPMLVVVVFDMIFERKLYDEDDELYNIDEK